MVCNQSPETQITMLKCTIAGGRTKGANDERSFVFVHQHGLDDVTWEPSEPLITVAQVFGRAEIESVNTNFHPSNCQWTFRNNYTSQYLKLILIESSANKELIKHARFSDADGNRKLAVFPLLTCLHTTAFTLLSIFSPLEMIGIKIWETPLSWHAKFSLPVAVRVSKTRVLTLPNIAGDPRIVFL